MDIRTHLNVTCGADKTCTAQGPPGFLAGRHNGQASLSSGPAVYDSIPAPNSTFGPIAQKNQVPTSWNQLKTLSVDIGSGIMFDILGMPSFARGENLVHGVWQVIDVPFDVEDTSQGEVARFGDWTALECGLWSCLQALDVSVSRGVYSERVINGPPGYRQGNETIYQPPETFRASSEITYASIHDNDLNNPDSFMDPGLDLDGCGNVSVGASAIREVTKSYSAISLGWQKASLPSWGATPIMTAYSSNRADMHGWMQRLAKSLSNTLRGNYGVHPKDDVYAGRTEIYELYIAVSWSWLVYPIGLVCAGALYLVASIIATERAGIGAWKSDPLIMLLADAHEDIKHSVKNRVKRWYDMGIRRQNTDEVALMREGDNWMFRKI